VEHDDLTVECRVEDQVRIAAERQNANGGPLIQATAGAWEFGDELDRLADAAFYVDRPLRLRARR
jgi:hypothetical protein